jgi:hypothetical protein
LVLLFSLFDAHMRRPASFRLGKGTSPIVLLQVVSYEGTDQGFDHFETGLRGRISCTFTYFHTRLGQLSS